MKKELILLCVVLIMMPLVLGIEIDLVRDSYYGWETLQAEISGNFISLSDENVLIYEKGSVSPEAVFSGLIKRGDKYYFYAVLPERAGNFSLKIEDVQYIQSRKLIRADIVKDFAILKNNGSILSINCIGLSTRTPDNFPFSFIIEPPEISVFSLILARFNV